MFLPHLQSDDLILADKGFIISDLLQADIGLNMLPFVSFSKQMTVEEFFKPQQIVKPRIVVEMRMEQIKRHYRRFCLFLKQILLSKSFNLYCLDKLV